jgi:hypothetical protein
MKTAKYMTVIACTIMMLLSASSVFAAAPGKGQINGTTKGGITQFVVLYNISSMMGEPTVSGNYMWNSNSVKNLDYHTIVWLHIHNNINGDAWIRLDPTVPNRGEWSYNVTGSPNWDQVLVASWTLETTTGYVPANIAKDFWRNGFWVTEAILSRYPR